MFVEGTSQEKHRLLLAGARSNCGDEAVFDIQIPFVPVTINSFPSAEQATQAHGASARLFEIHDAPRFVEVQISKFPFIALNLMPSKSDPSAEQTISPPRAVLVTDQVVPQLVDMNKPALFPAINLLPSAVDRMQDGDWPGMGTAGCHETPVFVETSTCVLLPLRVPASLVPSAVQMTEAHGSSMVATVDQLVPQFVEP